MSDMVPALERVNLEALSDQYRAATTETVEQCGVVVREMGVGTLLAATRLGIVELNRLLGVGLTRTPSEAELAEMVQAFEEVGAPRYMVPVPPTEANRDVGRRLEDLGLRHYYNWMRLTREVTDLPVIAPSSVTVARTGPADADTFTKILAEAFGFSPAIAPLAGAVIGRPGWHHYLAYEDDEPIGTAAMFVSGAWAWFGFAATVASHRGRGAQTSLVTRRLRDAASEGCRWVSVETMEQTPERDVPSFRNLTRLGFSVAYRRPNYVWVREDAGS